MALRLVYAAAPRRLRGTHADAWRTIAAWIWATYLVVAAAALLWWLF
jgi:hypothetical protein